MALSDGLVGYWNFDEASGNLLDQVASNNGTLIGTTQGATGKINDGYSFDGNDRIFLDNTFGDAPSLSISIWMNMTALTSSEQIIFWEGTNPALAVIFRSGNLSFFRTKDNDDLILADADLPTGEFVHLVYVANASTNTKQIWVNGVKKSENTGWTGEANTTNHQEAGFGSIRPETNPSAYFTGILDECGYWNKALTSSEIAELYNSGNGLAYPFSVSTNTKINIGDVFKDVDSLQINIGDVWKDVASIQQNIGDVWKTVF